MRNHLPRFIMLSIAGWLAFSPLAHAGEEVFDIDARFRAKIAKEKLKQGFAQRQALQNSSASDEPSSDCGSQNIGNVNNSGRKAGQPAPREVFVFAPNAINLVTGSGCR